MSRPDDQHQSRAGGDSDHPTIRRLVERTLDRVEKVGSEFNAFTAVTRQRALRQAEMLDRDRAAEKSLPSLAGRTFAAKNLFDIEGLPTLAGSAIHKNRQPAQGDAEAVRLLTGAGAILVGATNMDEFAYGFTTENAYFGSTRNPHDTSRTAGGSSGGSAAAVAAGLVDVALGSDTNGSIRVPASFCGIYGFKPTYGRISTRGVFPFVKSLDHAGPFARTAGDLAAVSSVLLNDREPDPALDESRMDGGLRIGVLGGYFAEGMSDEVTSAMDAFCSAFPGADHLELARVAEMRAAAFLITASEGGSRHADNLRRHYADMGPSTRERLAAGLIAPAEWRARSYRLREWFRRQVLEVFRRYDILLAPATPCVAPKLGQETIVIGGKEVPARASLGLYTQPLTPTGAPIAAAPLANMPGLPVGIQIMGAPFRDRLVLAFAGHLERQGLLASSIEQREEHVK